jgi:hypothetical protein
MRSRAHRLVALALLPVSAAAAPEVTRTEDPRTGLLSWTVDHGPFHMELLQVLPDFVRAGYASRGLPPELIEGVAGHCVFGTIVRNVSDAPLSYDMSRWRYVTPAGETRRIKTKGEWLAEWQDMGVAFRYSILPEAQTFAPGDWGQGFSTYDLPPGSLLDLRYTWSQHGETHTGTVPDLRCAPAEAPVP